MRKMIAFVISILCFVLFPFAPTSVKANAISVVSTAETEQVKNDINLLLNEFVEDGVQRKERAYRVAGSLAELNAAKYIKSKLDNLTNFRPVNDISTVDGIQSFEFISKYDSNTYTSQNIIYRKESMAANGKKVVLSAHYDTTYVQDPSREDLGLGIGVVSDGVNDNGASVATLIELANRLDSLDDLGYSIEIVFFGASSNNYDGSRFYSRGLSETAAENLLLVVNLDRIALGDYNYMYVNEFETPQQKYYFSLLSDLGFKKFNHANVVDFYQNSPNGLDYSHVALEGDHAIFMNRNINVLSFFSGNYEKPLTAGINESNDYATNLTFTENDTLAAIRTKGINYLDNLANVERGIETIIRNDEFLSNMLVNSGSKSFYNFFKSDKIAVFITAVLLLVCIFLYYLFYLKLQQRSRKSVNTKDVENVVMRITKNLGDDDETLNFVIDQKVKSDTQKAKNEGEAEKEEKDKKDKDKK